MLRVCVSGLSVVCRSVRSCSAALRRRPATSCHVTWRRCLHCVQRCSMNLRVTSSHSTPYSVYQSLTVLLSMYSCMRAQGSTDLSFLSPQLNTSRSYKTRPLILGFAHRVVCPFTAKLSLILIKRRRRDGTLSWHWCIVAVCGWDSNPAIAWLQISHFYHMTTTSAFVANSACEIIMFNQLITGVKFYSEQLLFVDLFPQLQICVVEMWCLICCRTLTSVVSVVDSDSQVNEVLQLKSWVSVTFAKIMTCGPVCAFFF